MRSVKFLSFALVCTTLVFSSCKREYICTCCSDVTNGCEDFQMKEKTRKLAKDECNQYNGQPLKNGFGCELNGSY